jgi:hypothetical protein
LLKKVAEEVFNALSSKIFVAFKKLFQQNSFIYFCTRDFALSNKKRIRSLRHSVSKFIFNAKLMQNFCPTSYLTQACLHKLISAIYKYMMTSIINFQTRLCRSLFTPDDYIVLLNNFPQEKKNECS